MRNRLFAGSPFNPEACVTPAQEAKAMAQTKALLTSILAMSREIGLPDSEVGRAIDLYTATLEGIIYGDEIQRAAHREMTIASLRKRGVRAVASRNRSLSSGPVNAATLGQSEDGLDDMSTEDLDALFNRADAIKPV